MHQGDPDTEHGSLSGNQKGTWLLFLIGVELNTFYAQTFYHEVEGCKQISHPNILPVIQVSETLFPLCIVSPWMPDGNIMQYVRKHDDANRLMLVRVRQG